MVSSRTKFWALGLLVGAAVLLAGLLVTMHPVEAAVGGKRAGILSPFSATAKVGSDPATHPGTYGGYGFAWDVYGGAYKAVYPRFKTNDGTLTLKVADIGTPSGAIGDYVDVEVKVSGTVVGKLSYLHLKDVQVEEGDTVTGSTVLGYTAKDEPVGPKVDGKQGIGFAYSNQWQVTSAAGIHVHVKFMKACYAEISANTSVSTSKGIGMLSSNYEGNNNSKCDANELNGVLTGVTTIQDGHFLRVSDDGNKIYRVAGGAPMYVQSWANVGGQQTVQHVITKAQLDAMPDYPRDGTYIKSGATPQRSYVVAGSAPMYIQDWANVGGPKTPIIVDPWAINNLPDYPADGTYIKSGAIPQRAYVVAGGAPMYIQDWANVGGPKSPTIVDPWAINNLPDYPADGTYIESGVTPHRAYVVAGGAPMYIDNWANIGGSKPVTVVDPGAIDDLRDYPANGTFIESGQYGKAYVVAGGAPMYIDSWANIGGPQAVTVVDQWALDHMLTYPVDDTFVREYVTGRVYHVVNQSLVYISDPAQITNPAVNIDSWALYNQLGLTP